MEEENIVKEEVIVENPEENEEIEVDVTEISLSEEEINSWINQLENLRETKSPIQIELDENNELLITYDENPEYEEEDDEEYEDEEEDLE